MSTQINLRFDDRTVAALDDLAADEGRSRAEVVRDAVHRRLSALASEEIDEAYRRAYTEHPETAEEMRRAHDNAVRLTNEEPWEPWW